MYTVALAWCWSWLAFTESQDFMHKYSPPCVKYTTMQEE